MAQHRMLWVLCPAVVTVVQERARHQQHACQVVCLVPQRGVWVHMWVWVQWADCYQQQQLLLLQFFS